MVRVNTARPGAAYGGGGGTDDGSRTRRGRSPFRRCTRASTPHVRNSRNSRSTKRGAAATLAMIA